MFPSRILVCAKWELSTCDIGHFLLCNCLHSCSLFLLYTPLFLTTPLSHTWLLFLLQNHYHWPMRNVSGTLGTVRHHHHHHHHLSLPLRRLSLHAIFFFLTFLFSSQSAAWANTHPAQRVCVFASVFEPFGVDADFYLLKGVSVCQNVSTGIFSDFSSNGLDRIQLKWPKIVVVFLSQCCMWCM